MTREPIHERTDPSEALGGPAEEDRQEGRGTRAVPRDIRDYQNGLDAEARPICDLLLATIEHELPDADRKVWHAHPVWFFDGNPVVGYRRLKSSVRLLFWSGQSFREPGLTAEGTFRAAEVRYTTAEQVEVEMLRRWLSEARDIQWNYRDIRRNRGLVPLRGTESRDCLPTAATDHSARIVLLLGGINVGGHRLAMPVLRSALETAGCTDVVTYIRSGNAVVTPPSREPRDLAATSSEAISAAAGFHVPVVLRTGAELAGVVDANPYPGTEGKHLHVVFFAEEPPATVLDGIDLPSFLPEACTLIGRELYLYLPNGMGRATLPAALDRTGRRSAPPVVATSRNWNTVRALLDLAHR